MKPGHALIICAAALLAYIAASRVSEQDIKGCQQSTGWTAARCLQELSR